MWHSKMHFSALLYSGFISSTIQTINIQNSNRIPFGCKKYVFLHDTQLWFPDYKAFSVIGGAICTVLYLTISIQLMVVNTVLYIGISLW